MTPNKKTAARTEETPNDNVIKFELDLQDIGSCKHAILPILCENIVLDTPNSSTTCVTGTKITFYFPIIDGEDFNKGRYKAYYEDGGIVFLTYPVFPSYFLNDTLAFLTRMNPNIQQNEIITSAQATSGKDKAYKTYAMILPDGTKVNNKHFNDEYGDPEDNEFAVNIELIPNKFKLLDGHFAEQEQLVGAFSAFVEDSELKSTLKQPDIDARSSQHKMNSLYNRKAKTSGDDYNEQYRQEHEDTRSHFNEENANDQYGDFVGRKGQRHHGKGQRRRHY